MPVLSCVKKKRDEGCPRNLHDPVLHCNTQIGRLMKE